MVKQIIELKDMFIFVENSDRAIAFWHCNLFTVMLNVVCFSLQVNPRRDLKKLEVSNHYAVKIFVGFHLVGLLIYVGLKIKEVLLAYLPESIRYKEIISSPIHDYVRLSKP